jgi:hypothetical protein
VVKGLLQIDFVPSGDQVTYGFTKALQIRVLENFKYNLNLTKVWGMLEIRYNPYVNQLLYRDSPSLFHVL